jgi:hypothetical protein
MPSDTHRGEEASAIGRQLMLDALGSEDAVMKPIGGRPSLGHWTTGGSASPTIRVRVTTTQREGVIMLQNRLNVNHDSDIVMAALDEYMSKQLETNA